MQGQDGELGLSHRKMLLLTLLPWEVGGRDSACPSRKSWAAEKPQAQKPRPSSRCSQTSISALHFSALL